MKASIIFAFSLGAAAGAAVTWKVLTTKYDRLIQEEIDSVKAAYARRAPKAESSETEESDEEPAPGKLLTEYKEVAKRYDNPSDDKEDDVMYKPFVIPPEEFATLDDYETVSLTYYSDGVLTDDRDIPIEDVEGLVGEESLHHFGEYEDDSVFVRNNELKTDYEILFDARKYCVHIKPGS